MFCTHCGKEIPEGSVYCVYCGASEGAEQAQAHTAQGTQANYTPGNMPNAPQTGIHLDNTAPWLLSVIPVLWVLAMMILLPINVPLALLVWALTIGCNAALYVMDRRQFTMGELDGWGWTAIVFPVVYLYMRAYKLDKKYGPAILRTVLIVVCCLSLSVWSALVIARHLFDWLKNLDWNWNFNLPF